MIDERGGLRNDVLQRLINERDERIIELDE